MMESYGIFPEGTRKGLIKTGEIKKGSILIGIKKKIPYLKELGITAIWLNPVFYSYQNHK